MHPFNPSRLSLCIIFCGGLLIFVASAGAQLVINPTFDSTITSDPNAAAIEAGINSTISRVEADIANPVTVSIDFQETNLGLGQSQSFRDNITYSQYLSDLQTKQTPSVNDVLALSTLPAGPNNPVNGSTSVNLADPLLRALGESIGNNTGFDSTISLNTSIMNFSRTGSQDPTKYDLQAVAGHEIDEVLGIGGAGSTMQLTAGYTGQPSPTGAVGALDLYRYTSSGVRSFTMNPAAVSPYFSIDGGKTNFVYFNQNGVDGADFADWGNGVIGAQSGNSPPQLQDAFGNPGGIVNIGANELAAFDIEGWNLTPAGTAAEAFVPEPASCTLLVIGAIGLLRRRRAAI